MPQAIWKFPLEVTDLQFVPMPAAAEILSVAVQREQIVLYALVDPNAPTVDQWFAIVGTGHPVPQSVSRKNFLGTASLHGGALMFHVFRVGV